MHVHGDPRASKRFQKAQSGGRGRVEDFTLYSYYSYLYFAWRGVVIMVWYAGRVESPV